MAQAAEDILCGIVDTGALPEVRHLPLVPALLRSARALMSFDLAALREAVGDFDHAPTGGDFLADHLGLELLVFRYISLEGGSLSNDLMLRILPWAERIRRRDLVDVIAIERAANLMGRGYYLSARGILAALRARESLPGWWALRGRVVAGISSQALGDFKGSQKALKEQDELVRRHPSMSMQFGILRRTLSLLIESEQVAKAKSLLRENRETILRSPFPLVRALILQEELKLSKLVGDSGDTESTFKRAQDFLKESGVSRNRVHPVESEIERLLAVRDDSGAMSLIEETLRSSLTDGRVSAQFIAQTLLGKCFLHQGQASRARQALEAALVVADHEEYGRDKVRALVLLGSATLRLGERETAAAHFQRAVRYALAFDLPIHSRFIAYVQALLAGHGALLGFLAERPLSPDEFAILERLRKWNHIDDHVVGSDSSLATSRGALRPLQFLERALASKNILFHFPKPGAFLWFKARGLELIFVPKGKSTEKAFRLLLAARRQGLTLAALHSALEGNLRWNPERHAGKLHSVFSQLRAWMRTHELPLKLVHRPGRGTYHLETAGFELETVTGVNPRAPAKTGKHREGILALLQNGKGQSGAEIAKSLGISRQAIHAALKRLEAEGRVVFAKKGRGSTYVSTDERPRCDS